MKRRLDITAFLIIFFSMALLASASDIREDLRYFKPIPKSKDNADVLRIRLDSDIHYACFSSYSNIRILNSKGTEIPFIIRPDTYKETQTEYSYNPAKIISLKKLDDNRLEICIKVPLVIPIVSGLTIMTPSKNFEKQVTVEESSDMAAWKPVCTDQTIFDYSEVTPISNSSIKFPPSEMEYFRLTISNFSENRKSPRTELVNEKREGSDFSRIEKMTISAEHLKIDEIGFLVKSEKVLWSKNRTQETPAVGFTTNEIKGKTEITFSTRHDPLDSIKLETSSLNFSRNCRIDISSDGKEWEYVSDGKLTSIDIAGYKESNLTLNTCADRSKNYYKITVLNGDAPPLKLTGVKAYSTVTFLELINSRDASMDGLSIYYGGVGIPRPSYDIGDVLAKLKSPSYSELTLGAQQDNPAYKPGPRYSSFLNSKHFFTAIVIFMVLILSLTLFKSFRKIESISDEK